MPAVTSVCYLLFSHFYYRQSIAKFKNRSETEKLPKRQTKKHKSKCIRKSKLLLRRIIQYIRDFNLPPISFVQLVPRFVPRCHLHSFIPEPTARSAVPGASPGRGLLIPLSVAKFKVVVHGRWG